MTANLASRARQWFWLGALLLVAFNLRPTAVAVGPVLQRIIADLHMGPTEAGVLTALPTLCFSLFGSGASWLGARVGLHRAVGAGLVMVCVGQLARTWATSPLPFLLASGFALGGMALANVLLPSLVREHFPHRVALVTACYSASLATGLALASLATAPLALTLGSWRLALGAWALAGVAALLPWLLTVRADRGRHAARNGRQAITMRDVARTKVGWYMVVFFAVQSASAYSVFGWLPSIFAAAGATETTAGFYLGITTTLGIPLAFLLPAYTARHSPAGMIQVIAASGVVGYEGLLWSPMSAPWLWAALIAVATASFPIYLALIGMKARTAEGTAALSGFSQSVAYLFAGLGPFTMSMLHEMTTTWSASVGMLLVLLVPLTVFSLLSSRAGFVEDEIQRQKSTGQRA